MRKAELDHMLETAVARALGVRMPVGRTARRPVRRTARSHGATSKRAA